MQYKVQLNLLFLYDCKIFADKTSYSFVWC